MVKFMMRIIDPYMCVHACVCACVGKVRAVQFFGINALMAVSLIECMFLFRCLLRFRGWVGDLVLQDVCETSCACARARACVCVRVCVCV